MEKSLEYIDRADLILFVVDAGCEFSDDELEFLEKIKEKRCLVVGNKCDSIADENKKDEKN